MKKLIFTAVSIGVTVMTGAAFAGDTLSGCGHFHVQVANLTKDACVLTTMNVLHGNLISSPAGSILPGDSKAFDMQQTIFGPKITLTYQCGSESVTFTSKQDLCVLEAGNVTGTITTPMPVNIIANYSATLGSYFWEKPGMINWQIVKTIS